MEFTAATSGVLPRSGFCRPFPTATAATTTSSDTRWCARSTSTHGSTYTSRRTHFRGTYPATSVQSRGRLAAVSGPDADAESAEPGLLPADAAVLLVADSHLPTPAAAAPGTAVPAHAAPPSRSYGGIREQAASHRGRI